MSVPQDEIEVGPFVFEYDEDRHEMNVCLPEEVIGNIDCIFPDRWMEFVEAVRKGTG